MNLLPYARQYEVVAAGERFEGDADDLCPHFVQPDAEPGTFETGVAGDEHPLAFQGVAYQCVVRVHGVGRVRYF